MNNKKPPSVTNEPGTCFCPVIFGRAERINAIMFQCWSDSKDLDLVRFFTFLHIHNWHASATETWAPSFLLDNFSHTHTRTHTHTPEVEVLDMCCIPQHANIWCGHSARDGFQVIFFCLYRRGSRPKNVTAMQSLVTVSVQFLNFTLFFPKTMWPHWRVRTITVNEPVWNQSEPRRKPIAN